MSYNHIVPPGTFIRRYMDHMNSSETATDYDFWCALWLLSLACGRSLVVDRPRAPVYMNLYCILVAESGITRKSSAVRVASKLANTLLSDNPHMGLIEGKTVPEKLDEILHRRTAAVGSSQLAIAISELAVFLGMEKYSSTMPALLTDLYDCPALRRGGGTLSRGGVEQHDVFVSFLSASTPAWLLRSVNPSVVQGGFTSRCVFVVSESAKRRIAWDGVSQAWSDSEAENALLKDLRQVRELANKHRTLTLNEPALRAFRNWYARRKFSIDDFRSSFESREDAHVLRVAAFLCINDDSWVIQHGHIRRAIKLVLGVKTAAARLFHGTGTRSKFVLGLEAMKDTLLMAGLDAIPRSKLFLKCRRYLDNAEFMALLDVMHEVGAIQRFEMKHDGAGRPIDLIRATTTLVGRRATEKIMERFT